MMIKFTELIAHQAETTAVRFCAGIFTETLWQIKKRLQYIATGRGLRIVEELIFWVASGAALSAFLYYCAFGKITFHAVLGFSAGLLLWKKICCVIIRTWVKDDAAKNSKITAKSSTWNKPGGSGWRKDGRKGKKKKRKLRNPPDRRQEEKWLSEETATDGD